MDEFKAADKAAMDKTDLITKKISAMKEKPALSTRTIGKVYGRPDHAHQ